LKEKLLAAHRHGIYVAVLPKDNEKDLPDIPENIRKDMKMHFVTSMDEVLKLALEREVQPLAITPGLTAADLMPHPPAEEKITH
jgi:ATP-dependent Lon protease